MGQGKVAHGGTKNTCDYRHNTGQSHLVPSSRHKMFATVAAENQESRDMIAGREKKRQCQTFAAVILWFTPLRDIPVPTQHWENLHLLLAQQQYQSTTLDPGGHFWVSGCFCFLNESLKLGSGILEANPYSLSLWTITNV